MARRTKIALIESINREWRDLTADCAFARVAPESLPMLDVIVTGLGYRLTLATQRYNNFFGGLPSFKVSVRLIPGVPALFRPSSPTERPNRILQRLHAREMQRRGSRLDASKLMGERGDALAVTVGLTGLPREVLKFVRANVADLFSGIRAGKAALIGGNGLRGR